MTTSRRKTIKDIVSQVSLEIGLSQKALSQVVSSNDQDVIQMVALMYAVADELLLEEPYEMSLGDGKWVIDADGTLKERITNDTDFVAFDSRLAINGVKWRFLQAKGLEFGEQQRDFTTRLNKVAARVNSGVLDLDEEPARAQ